MHTKVVSFFIFSKSFQTKKIKALRKLQPKMTKIASRGVLPLFSVAMIPLTKTKKTSK